MEAGGLGTPGGPSVCQPVTSSILSLSRQPRMLGSTHPVCGSGTWLDRVSDFSMCTAHSARSIRWTCGSQGTFLGMSKETPVAAGCHGAGRQSRVCALAGGQPGLLGPCSHSAGS